MSYRGRFCNYAPMAKGLFDSLNSIDIDPTYTTDTRNSRFGPNYVRKRNGMTVIGGVVKAATRFTGGFQYRNPSGAIRDCVTMADGKFYALIGSTWTDRTGVVVLSTATDNRVHMTAFNGLVVGTDNVNPLFVWDGNTANSILTAAGIWDTSKWDTGRWGTAVPQRVRLLQNFGDRLIALDFTASDGTARPDGFAWSGLNNPSSWDTTVNGFLRIQQAGGNPIYGAGQSGDRMIVLFEDALYEVAQTGNDLMPYQASLLAYGVGTRAPYAVISHGNDVYFLTENGPERLSMVLADKIGEFSEPIRQFWSTVDYSQSLTFSGAYSDGEKALKWGVRLSAGTENTRTIVYRVDTGAWSIDDNYVADVMWPYRNSSSKKTTACGSTDRAFELDRGTTDLVPATGAASNIPWYIWTPWLDCHEAESGPKHIKLWQDFQCQYLQQTGNTMDIGYQLALFPDLRVTTSIVLLNYNNAGIWDQGMWDIAVWGGANEDQAQTSIPLEGDSTHIRFKFVNNAAVQVTLEGFEISFFDTRSV